ncbi:hypothetical protein [Bacteroides cellulosilyticus]|uniref:Uncharacterized protein n=1 Tax=Bacteroides cellulosilyticus DSM 14838 TaxID=537012 RepID=E2N7X8_9BACE|nr:hypothetical protein [Bacteroides cellulosilyticus]EEF91981.1 hypothetical protein BACCELL_00373 [Bacteroides cellulosilyticus DSM 14838]MBN9710402.1 histidine kinase [Bacteroides cellulosilyticus]MDC7305059.1 histidine kinase [Bacteroides cellulosilyticus DSM 14838]
MRLTSKQKKEFFGLAVWGILGLIAMSVMMALAGCATPKNTDRNTQVDYSNVLQQMQSRMDTLLANMEAQRKETSEKLSNLKVENRTVYLSPPDSTGKQYPTIVSETNASKDEKENKTTETELKVTIQRLVEEVTDLRNELNTAIVQKEKVKEVSWWQLHKVDVYVGLFILVLGWLIYKKNK